MSITNADMYTYALMNGISITEAKKQVTQRVTTGATSTNPTDKTNGNEGDSFVSSAITAGVKFCSEEFEKFENFFSMEEKVQQVAGDIESFVTNLAGKPLSEIVKSCADNFKITVAEAAGIFTQDLVDLILGNDEEEDYTNDGDQGEVQQSQDATGTDTVAV